MTSLPDPAAERGKSKAPCISMSERVSASFEMQGVFKAFFADALRDR